MPKKFDRINFKTSTQIAGGFEVYIDREKAGEAYTTVESVGGVHYWRIVPDDVEVLEAFTGIVDVMFPDRMTAARCLQAMVDGDTDLFKATRSYFSLAIVHIIEQGRSFIATLENLEGGENDTLPMIELMDSLERGLHDYDPERLDPDNRKNNKGKRGRRYRN